ncbi:hypothetical protein QPI26_004228 [Vibrio vulnificus]|nr:hypothetical protein [Vibrio vulnificus]
MELRVSHKTGLKLYSNLISIDTVYHEELRIKHPADILKNSIEKLEFALNEFIDGRSRHVLDESKERSIRNYICELDSFYDRLLLVMKALTKPSHEDNKNADIWLKENNSEKYTLFKDSVSQTHKMIRDISNVIKHDAHSVGYLTVTDHEGKLVDGFYFSNVVGEKELLGPCPRIHEEYRGASTAISYDFFLRYSLGFVVSCLYQVNRIFFKGSKPKPMVFQSFIQYVEKHLEVGTHMFPNEYGRAVAYLSQDKMCVVVKYPYREKKSDDVDRILSVQPFFRFNQRTNSANDKFPYFQLLS